MTISSKITKEKKVCFKVEEFRFGELREAATKEGVSVSTILRHLVIKYLEHCKHQGFLR